MKRIKNITILALIVLFSLLNNLIIAQDYPLSLTETKTIQIENDTLWILTHNQYINCIKNTILLNSVNRKIILYEKNEIEYKKLVKFLKQDVETMEIIYFETLNNLESCKRNKKNWRTATIVAASIALLETLLITFK